MNELFVNFVKFKNVSEMDLQVVKIDVLQKIMNVSKISLLDKINDILDKEMIVGYTTDGEPLTKEAYNARLLLAEKQIASGNYISQEDLEKEVENW
ncbi:MAG: hypothetical protein WCX31_05780 [Salinivirgaceae bacterium]